MGRTAAYIDEAISIDCAGGRAVMLVTGHFGQYPFRPEKIWTKAWTFRPKHIDVSAKKSGPFGQNIFLNSS